MIAASKSALVELAGLLARAFLRLSRTTSQGATSCTKEPRKRLEVVAQESHCCEPETQVGGAR